MKGTRALVKGRQSVNARREGGSKLRGKGLLIGMLMVAVASLSFTALGFEAYFSDGSGVPVTEIWEGRSVHVSVEDPFKVACGVDSFKAEVLIFDYKTGAYRELEATFVETGYAEGVFVWDQGAIPVGDRANWQPISYEYPYQLADRTLREQLAIGFEHVTDNRTDGPGLDGRWWEDGNWEYVDDAVSVVPGGIGGDPTFGAGNNTGRAQRFQFVDQQHELYEVGRFENNDTLVVFVQDQLDGFWGAGQLKVKRTQAEIRTSITEVYYGCSDIILEIEDPDESLSSDRPDFVPFFAIVNPGSWDAVEPAQVVDPEEYTLTINVAYYDADDDRIVEDPPFEVGTTVPEPEVGHVYTEGTVVDLEAIGTSPYTFFYWEGPVADEEAAQTTVTITEDTELTALFGIGEPPPFPFEQRGSEIAAAALGTAQPTANNNTSGDEVINNFCALMRTGGVDPYTGEVLDDPIRWYNIYDMRYIRYPFDEDARETRPDGWSWAPEGDPSGNTDNVAASLIAPDGQSDIERMDGMARVTFYAQETGSNTGVFRFNFGSLDQLQKRLGFGRLPAGTTIAFYYVDPNDFSDMAVTTVHVASPYTRSEVEITDARGNKVDEVRLGEDGLHFRVTDPKQSMDDCLQESVLVHVCDVHGEDDSEYWNLDEISAAAGVFAHSGAMRLDPVWDAVGGYQLELDDQRFQAFNADTIFVRYNSVRYNPDDVAALGTGGPGLGEHFAPGIITEDPRFVDPVDLPYYAWDVSFDTVQVYDYQVFDGTRTTIQFLDGRFRDVDTYRPADQIYIEVTDYDQNEDSRIAERISGRWDRVPGDSSPVWGPQNNVFGDFFGRDFRDDNAAKIFVFNPRTGQMKALDLMETGRDTGVFRSTTGITVADLGAGAREGDMVVAFYQDPSNHHDIAIKTIRVKADEPVPPERSVSFDATSYYVGETATITVTDEAYDGFGEIEGDNVLVLKDADGTVVESWNVLPSANGDEFTVEIELPENYATGTWRVEYVDPADDDRTASATAQVRSRAIEEVHGIDIDPEFLVNEVTFSLITDPEGAIADRFTIMVYDLTGRKVDEFSATNTRTLTWDGGNLRSTAYIYVAVVEDDGRSWTFRGPVYIRR